MKTAPDRRVPRARLKLPIAALAWAVLPRKATRLSAVPTLLVASTLPSPATAMTPEIPVEIERALARVGEVDPAIVERLRDAVRVEFTWTPLPFYPSHGLLRGVGWAQPHPVLGLWLATRASVLGAGRSQDARGTAPGALLPLGTPERLAAANAAAGLRLDEGTAVEYLRFALGAVGGSPTTRPSLVSSADRLPWWPRPSADDAARIAAARARLAGRVAPPRVRRDASGAIVVAAEALVATALRSIVWRIALDGRIEQSSVDTIEDDLPVVVVA